MLVHIIVSCDYNPFLDPGLWVASLHSLHNVEELMMTKRETKGTVVFIIFVSP